MTAAAYIISILLQLVLPAALVFLIIHYFHTGWKFAILGAMAYMAANLLHSFVLGATITIDMYNSIVTAGPMYWIFVLFAVSAILQQLARWFAFRFSGGPGTTWEQVLTMGAGFGGFELIMLGATITLGFFNYVQINSSGGQGMNIPPESLPAVLSQNAIFWAKPFYLVLLETLPGLSGMVLQFTLAAMAWVAVRTRSYLWHAAAVLWMMALSSVGIVFSLWNQWAAPVNDVYPPDAALALMGYLLLIGANLVVLYVFFYRIRPLVEQVPVPLTVIPAKSRPAAPKEQPKLAVNEKKNRPVKPVKLPNKNND
jgi:uncharacterized membrane protein YhfC